MLDVDLRASGLRLRVYVDGQPYEGDPKESELMDMRRVLLDIGPPFVVF